MKKSMIVCLLLICIISSTKCFASGYSRFNSESDKRLLHLTRLYGTDDWNIISENLPGFSPKKCAERYRSYLNLDDSGPQTDEEISTLMSKHYDLGNRWGFISQFLPRKSVASARNKFRVLKGKEEQVRSLQGEQDGQESDFIYLLDSEGKFIGDENERLFKDFWKWLFH